MSLFNILYLLKRSENSAKNSKTYSLTNQGDYDNITSALWQRYQNVEATIDDVFCSD